MTQHELNADIKNTRPFFDEKRLYKVVGENSRRAREIAGLTRRDAYTRVWGNDIDEMPPNIISIHEDGNKKIDLATIYRMCIEYGCSADYLLGLSNEFERDLAASYNGLVFNSVRGSVLEATARICDNLNDLLDRLPPFQGELLRSSAKNVVETMERLQKNDEFSTKYPDLTDAVYDLREKVQMFDLYFAKQMRIMELNMLDQIHHKDDEAASVTMTDYQDLPKSVKY